MANVNISPNMNLPVPVVGVDLAPDWATNINACLAKVDTHDHTQGNGVPVTPGGMNINSDLNFQINSATNVKNLGLSLQLAPLSGAFMGFVYRVNGDLYWNNGAGTPVQITSGGSVTGSPGTITGLPSGTASATYISAQGTFQFQQSTGLGANIDAAAYVLRYPGSYPTPSGNYIALQAPSSITSYALTFPSAVAASNGSLLTSSNTGQLSYSVVDNTTIQLSAGVLGIKPQGVTQDLLAPRATGTTVGVGGVAISGSSGAYSNGSPTPVDVTNLSVTITTTGRPVAIILTADGSGSQANIGSSRGTNNTIGFFNIVRGASTISSSIIQSVIPAGSVQIYSPPGSVAFTDVVGAGTYTYKLQAYALGTVFIQFCQLVVYEL